MTQQAPHPAVSASQPPAATRSAVGTVSDLAAGEVLLPDFVAHDAAGVQVDRRMMGDSAQMQRFVDRVFSAGAYFVGLDHAAFSHLLYSQATTGLPADKETLRIADDIAKFTAERRELYKNAKSVDKGARIEYFFEPVRLEHIVEVPIFGDEDEAGKSVLTGYDRQVRYEPTKLDVDEFVAAMWLQGIRSGIDMAAVRATIESGRVERIEIARRVDPLDGADATVLEQTDALHRDDSPSILPDGKVDLHHFKNHFPQVTAGTRLLQKQPRRLGVAGIDIDGTVLEPPVPRDFELETLAGMGTRVERTAKGEFLVAARDGFLNIDTKSQQISITEKIVNRNGVSLRTTGNLALAGDHYEEYGEVQEHRVVQGKHMNFHADVFGGIVSSGGQVHLCGNLVSGSVQDTGGLIQIDGRASRAVLEAREGEVCTGYAESVTVIARKVKLGRAVACDIVAEDVEIDEAVGCTIAARHVRIARAGVHRGTETLITVCVPDFASLNRRRVESTGDIERLEGRIKARQARHDACTASDEIRKYLAADQGIRAGLIKLNPNQEVQWRQATQKLCGPLFEIQALQKEIDTLNASLGEQNARLAELDSQRARAGANIRCQVGLINGDVAVQSIAIDPEMPVFAGTDAATLKQKLRDTRAARERLFRGASGSFSWAWQAPAPH